MTNQTNYTNNIKNFKNYIKAINEVQQHEKGENKISEDKVNACVDAWQVYNVCHEAEGIDQSEREKAENTANENLEFIREYLIRHKENTVLLMSTVFFLRCTYFYISNITKR